MAKKSSGKKSSIKRPWLWIIICLICVGAAMGGNVDKKDDDSKPSQSRNITDLDTSDRSTPDTTVSTSDHLDKLNSGEVQTDQGSASEPEDSKLSSEPDSNIVSTDTSGSTTSDTAIPTSDKSEDDTANTSGPEETPESEPNSEPTPKPAEEPDLSTTSSAPTESSASELSGNNTSKKSGTYVGSTQSDKYHYPSCRHAKKIETENEIWFDTISEAQAAGYTACGVCHPR